MLLNSKKNQFVLGIVCGVKQSKKNPPNFSSFDVLKNVWRY